jgi:uncharacterized membrane protein YfcA
MGMSEPVIFALLVVVGLVAGWINTVAGAGSLLLLPALIFAGLPADAANATNRIAILVQSTAAVWGYHRAGLKIGRTERVLTLAGALGGVLGAFIATLLTTREIHHAIVIALAVMLVLSMVPKKKGADTLTLPPPTALTVFGLFCIGIYGGFLQAGVGILVLLFLSLIASAGLVASNVLKSTLTLALSIVSIAVFSARGETLDPLRGAALAIGSGMGGYLGAHATVKLGEKWIRVGIVLAVVAALTKLVWDLVHEG